MKKFKFYLIGLAHLPTSRKYMSCAFTQKNVKLAKMLADLGHEVILFGAKSKEDPFEYPGVRFVETHTVDDIAADYGDGDSRFELGYNWTKGDFRHDLDKVNKNSSTKKLLDTATHYIKKDKKGDEFLLLSQGGAYYSPIANATGLKLRCESGIGYRGSSKLNWRAFESTHIMDRMVGVEKGRGLALGTFGNRVIPNYWEPEEVLFNDSPEGEYLLFVGRMIKNKGLEFAIKTANILKKKLILAGQGAYVDENGWLQEYEPLNPNRPEFSFPPGTWEYVGYIDMEERKKLMANATLTFVPTIYTEIFGGVHVESMLSGTPVLTTNFGVYPGTYPDGIGGYHCDTLDDFVWYGRKIIDEWTPERRKITRKFAERYLTTNVKWQFQKWFEDLYEIEFGDTKNAWFTRNKNIKAREEIDKINESFFEL